MKKKSTDLQPGDVIRVAARRTRKLVTEHEYDDSQSHFEPAVDVDGEIWLVVRGSYADTGVRCIALGIGLADGEFVGTIHASVNEEFEIVEPEPVVRDAEPGDYAVVDVTIVEPDRETAGLDPIAILDALVGDEDELFRLTLAVATANGRRFTIDIDVDDMAAMLYDADVAGVDTNGEPFDEPEIGGVVSLLAAVTKVVDA